MARTYGVGRWYWHLIKLSANAPPIHLQETVEIDEPWRSGRSIVIHAIGPWGVVIGRWRRAPGDEDSNISTAFGARLFPAVRQGVLDEMFRDD